MKTADHSSTADGASTLNSAREWRDESRIVLRRGELHSWKRARVGTTIRAREGALWVTQEGDGRDVILSAGESFRVTRAGRVIAEALQGTARLAVAEEC